MWATRRPGATILPLGGSRSGWIHHEADSDYFQLDVPAETDVAVFTHSDVNLLGTLSDSRGNQVAADDDGGAGASFFMSATLAPGDHYINVDGDGNSTGPYVVHAIRDTPVEIPDDRLRDAVESVFSALGRGAITAGDLASLQAFSLPVARIERLDGFGHAANLRHLNLRYNRIEDASSLSGMTELAGLDLEGNAIYDIAALVENAGLGEGDKVVLAGNPLRQTALDAQLPLLEARGVFVGFLDDHGDRAGTATTLAPGANVAGTLSTLDDEDVFRLEIPAATDVVLYTTGSTNTRGHLSGVGPRRLATNNDGGRGANFMIRRRLNPGVYHVTVSGLDGFAGIGPYALHAEVPPTAPPMNITVLRDGSSLVVTWNPVPPEFAGAPITRYRAIATPSDGSAPITCTAPPAANGCTITDLPDNIDYTVTVQAINAVGYGPTSTTGPPPQPTDTDTPPSFWRGWRLSLAPPPTEDDVVAD